MFGKLFNTLQQTINMEPGTSGGSTGPSFSSAASSAGASLPSLADFGLGSLMGGSAPQQAPRPRAPGPGPGPRPPMMAQPRPPGPSGPPDVDLTGLSEEEKAMIQSVMMRAQESEAAKVPQVTPQTMGAPRQPMQQQPARPQVSPYSQPQQQQQPLPTTSQYSQQPPTSQYQQPPTSQYQQPPTSMGQQPPTSQYQQPPTSMGQQAPRPQQPQQQPAIMQQRTPQPQFQPQMQPQQQQMTRPQQAPVQTSSHQQFSQPLATIPSSQPQQLQQQQQQQLQQAPHSQSSQSVNQNQYGTSGGGMMPHAVSQPQVSMYQQEPVSMYQQEPSTSQAMVNTSQEQMMDRQNFIESLQRQAQPDSVVPSFSGPQMNSGQNVITSMYQGQNVPMSVPSSGYNPNMMATSSSQMIPSLASSSASFQTSSSFTTSSSVNPSFALSSMSGVPMQQSSSMSGVSMQQSLPNNNFQVNNKVLEERLMQSGQQHPSRKMVHQQSWTEGSFESVLPSVDTSIYNQSGRRKSLEGMSSITDMGMTMNRVIEPFEIKLPKMRMVGSPEEGSESSSQVSGSELSGSDGSKVMVESSTVAITVPGSSITTSSGAGGQGVNAPSSGAGGQGVNAPSSSMNIMITSASGEVVKSPPREYKSVSQPVNVSSRPITTSSMLHSCVNEPVLNVVTPIPILPQPPQSIDPPTSYEITKQVLPEPVPAVVPPQSQLPVTEPVPAVVPPQSQLPVTSSFMTGMMRMITPATKPPETQKMIPTVPITQKTAIQTIPTTQTIFPTQPLLPTHTILPEIPVSQYSVRTRLTPVSSLRSFEEPTPPVTPEIPVSQYSVRTRLTPVSSLRSFEEPSQVEQQPSPKAVPSSAYEFKTIPISETDVKIVAKSSESKLIPEREPVSEQTDPVRKMSVEQISPPKSAISSRKSSEIDFCSASITSPDTEALLQTLSKYDPTKVQPDIISPPDLARILSRKVSSPKVSPPKTASSAASPSETIAHHHRVAAEELMNPFSVILKSFDSPPEEVVPCLATHSSQTSPSCDFEVENEFSERIGEKKVHKVKQHVTTQTSKSMITKTTPSSLPKTVRSPSPGSTTTSSRATSSSRVTTSSPATTSSVDRKLIKTNVIIMTNTATSPLKPEEREEMSCTGRTVSSGIRGTGEGGLDFMSVRKLAETERRASFGGSSGVQSIPPGRSGALLPALPSGAGEAENKALSEKGLVWTRSGSLSEQQFIEQINEMRGLPPSASLLVSQGGRLKNEQQMDEQLNFELDEEYEREGEETLVEDDEDDLDVQRQLMSEAAGQVYTIPEESEEESPKVEKKEDEPRKGVCSRSIQSQAPRASRSLPSILSCRLSTLSLVLFSPSCLNRPKSSVPDCES